MEAVRINLACSGCSTALKKAIENRFLLVEIKGIIPESATSRSV